MMVLFLSSICCCTKHHHILNFKIWQRLWLCFPGWQVFMTLILAVPSESLDLSCIIFFLPVLFVLNFYFKKSILPVYMNMHHVSSWSLHWSKDGTRNSELGIIDSYVPSCNSLSPPVCKTRRTLWCWAIFPALCWLFVISILISIVFISPFVIF